MGYGGSVLMCRAGATTLHAHNQKITVTCRVVGQYVRGKVRRSAQWDRTMLDDWVSHAYVAGDPRLPVCGPPPSPPRPVPPAVVAAPVAVPMEPIANLTPVQFLAKYDPSVQQSQSDTAVPASERSQRLPV